MRVFIGLLCGLLSLFVSTTLSAQANLSTNLVFSPAQIGRTHIDIGGAWNGTMDVSSTTGDSFILTLDNTAGTDSAFDLVTSFTLPADVNIVSTTAGVSVTGAGCGAAPTATLVQAGTSVNVTYSPAGYDLPVNCSLEITMGAITTTTIAAGSKDFSSSTTFATTDGGGAGSPENSSVSVEVLGGEVLPSISSPDLEQAVGESVELNLQACNIGTGGLFDVTFDDTATNPNSAGSLQTASQTQTSPATPAASGILPLFTLPYLGPGECFDVTTIANILSCSEIDYNTDLTHRASASTTNLFESVTLDLTTPLVSFGSAGSSFIPPITVPSAGTNSITIPVFNVGPGIAQNLVVNLPIPGDVIVDNVGADWSFAAGAFTYNGGDIPGGGTQVDLTFDVSRALVCPPPAGRSESIIASAVYNDGCGNPYSLPVNIGSIIVQEAAEPFTLGKSTNSINTFVGSSGSWTLTVTRDTAANLTSDPLIISDVIPSGFVDSTSVAGAPAGTTFDCGGDTTCDPGETLNWSIPQAVLAANPSLALNINYTLSTDECSAGTSVTNSTTTNYNYTSANCSNSQTGNAIFYINTNDAVVTDGISNLAVSNTSIITNGFEAGLIDDGNGTREVANGEGEFVEFTRTLDFSSGGAGEWIGSTHNSTWGGTGALTLVPNSVTVSLNGGVAIAVPGGAITSSTGSFGLTLDFLAGATFLNNNNVAGQIVEIFYSATSTEAPIAAGETSYSVVDLATTSIANGAGGGTGCNVGGGPKEYRDFEFYSFYRKGLVAAINIPDVAEVCGVTPITINSNLRGPEFAYHPLLTLINTGYEFDVAQAITYGGDFTTGNITSNLLANNSTFEYGPEPLIQTQLSTIDFDVVIPAGSALTPQNLCVDMSYDSRQGLPGAGKNITNAQVCRAPQAVVAGDISLTITPDNNLITGTEKVFSIIVVNGGSGTAYNVVLSDTIPAGLNPDLATTNTLNASGPDPTATLTNAGRTFNWEIPSIAPGAQVEIMVAVTVDGSSCAPIVGANDINASWGCGGTNHQTVTSTLPNFNFVPASVSITHDANLSEVRLCDDGTASKAVISVKNDTIATIFDLMVEETLNSATSGISLATVPDFEYSIDNGVNWLPLTAPTGTGTTANPYVFDAGAILDPMGGFQALEVFKIRFNIAANEDANSNPDIFATAGGDISCGDAASTSASNFSINVIKPNIRVAKRGRNLTTGAAFDETAYGTDGDTIQWEVRVINSGQTSADFVELTDNFVNSSGSQSGTFVSPASLTGDTINDSVEVDVESTANGTTTTYIIDEVLGSSCVNGNNLASVSWACSLGSATRLTTPGDNDDTAALVMNGDPAITQAWDSSAVTSVNGKGDIVIDIVNNGAFIDNLSLNINILAGYQFDVTDVIEVTKDAVAVAVTTTGSPTAPTVTLPGTNLRNSEVLQIIIPVVPTNFDTNSDNIINPETVGNGFDNAPAATGNNSVAFNYSNGCGITNSSTSNVTLDPITTDIDIVVTPLDKVVADGETTTFTFTLTNNGDAGSIASDFDFAGTLGSAWTGISTMVLTPGIGGAGGACAAATCSAAQLGSLAQGSSAVVTIQATANSGSGPLTIEADTTGKVFSNSGVDLGNYSFDEAKSRVLGVTQSLTLDTTFGTAGTSEDFTTGTNLTIGEEIRYLLRFEVFGVEAGSPVSALTLRSTLPAGLGYVDSVQTAAHTAPAVVGSGTALQVGAIDFGTATDITVDSIFEVALTLRALNDDAINTDGAPKTLNLGSSYSLLGGVSSSDNGADGFGGSDATLHDDEASTIQRPNFTIQKLVRNISTGAFAATAQGDAGDIVEYQVTITNTGSAPGFNLNLPDTLDTKLNVIDGAADTIDNDGDGSVDGGDSEGSYGANTVTFNHANTLLTPTAGESMERLNPSETITFLYRATIDTSVVPTDILDNDAEIEWTSLPGASGSQSAPIGAADAAGGEAVETASAMASVEAVDVVFAKELVASSLTPIADLEAVIGEQLRFRLDIILPSGTVPAFRARDSLPEGFSLIEVTSTFGSSVTGCNSPTQTPAVLPANGSGADLSFELNFGTCSVAAGSDTDRMVRVEYVAQVRNIASNIAGATLDNTADFIFTGLDGPDSTVSIDIIEPSVTATKTLVSTSTPIDAGAIATYRVVVSNAASSSTAYDVDVTDTLPAGMSFVTASTVDEVGDSAGTPTTSGQNITWGRGASTIVNIAAGASFEYTYQVELQNTVEPEEVLTNAIDVSFTSLPNANPQLVASSLGAAGDVDGERNGASGSTLNDYFLEDGVDITVDSTYVATKTKTSTDTISGGGYRVGDLIEYELSITFQEGTTDNVVFTDTLPAGLALDSFDTIAPASDGVVFNYTVGAMPSAGDTGTIVWNLGTVVSDGDNVVTNQTLSFRYRARVLDTGGISNTPTDVTADNNFNFTYDDEAGNNQGPAASVVSVDIKQPELTIMKALAPAQSTTIEAGDTINYEITITNNGDAPAYNAVVRDILPLGARVNGVTTLATSTLNGGFATIAAPSYSAVTGTAVWSLSDAQAINPSQALVIRYSIQADSDIGAGLSLVNSARIDDYFSVPSLPGNTERRSYGGSANVQAAAVMTPAPTDMLKAIDATEFQVGDLVTYTLTVPQTTINSKIYDVNITDTLSSDLVFVSATTNGAAISETVNDTTAGNNVAIEFEEIDAGEQAIVTITARVRNNANNNATDTVDNSAAFDWASSDGGTTQAAINSNTVSLTIEEPVLEITKARTGQTVANTMIGFQAGDRVVYTITVENTGDGDAHQVLISDLANENYINPTVIANPDNPGAPTNAGTVSGVTTWNWNLASPILAGTTFQFDIEFTLGPSVQPLEVLLNQGTTSWKSTPIDNAETRDGSDGSGGLNDYADGPSSDQVAVSGVQFNKLLDATGPSTYSVGESVFYDLRVELIAGEVLNLRIEDTLPVSGGLEYVGSTLTSGNAQQIGGGAVAILAPAPTVGSTGVLTFDFGDIEGTNTSGVFINVRIETIVRDIVSNTSTTTLDNTGKIIYDDPANPGNDIEIPDPVAETITLENPVLVSALDGPTELALNSPVTMTGRIENTTNKPGFQPTYQVEFPVGTRDFDPTTGVETITITGGRSITLVKGVDFTTTYNPLTGIYEVVFISAQAYVDPSETINIGFQTQLDNDSAGGTSLEYDSAITSYYSVDDTTSPTINREVTGSLGTGTIGTANGAAGDDGRDNHSVTTAAPIITIIKSVDKVTVGTGETLTYTVVVSNTGTADGTLASLVDDMEAFYKAGTLVINSVTPACTGGCVQTINATGGSNSKGTWTLTNVPVPESGSVTVNFSIDLEDVIPSGTIIENQAEADVVGFTNNILSDSNSAVDDNGIEEGNNSGDNSDDDPTRSVIESTPDITFEKSSDHAGKTGPVAPGDILTYTILVSNTGTENTNSTTIVDTIPSFTTYVPNTTTVNGSLVADVGGTSALVSGLQVNTPSGAPGAIIVGETVTVQFQVQIDADVSGSAVISNVAQLNTVGDGSGPKPVQYSDNPETGVDGDPTQDFLSSAPQITATKSVVDINGAPLAIGEVVEYQITLRNDGLSDSGVSELTDIIPSDLTYVPGSLLVDIDGPNAAIGFTSFTDATDGDAGEVIGSNLKVSITSITAGEGFTVRFRATVNAGVAGGTVITNQAALTEAGEPTIFTDSDSSSNNGAQPTDIVVGNAPVLRMTKDVVDSNGGTLEPLDELLYTIIVNNTGSIDATNVIVTDPLPPAGTTYVAASTEVNSVNVPDVGSDSVLVGGYNIGTVAAGSSKIILVRVSVNAGLAAGFVISNQASFTADGGLTGISDSTSDDGVESGNNGTNPNDDDPTLISIGGAGNLAILQGSVWQDANSDRVFDSSETPLSGWKVEILLNGIVVDTTTTNTSGDYIFNGLAPGSGYQVQFRHPETNVVYGGAVSNVPAADTSDGTIRGLTLNPGLNLLEQNLPVDPSGIVYDSVARVPVTGVDVDLTGPPGFDPATMTLPGQFGQVTGSDGFYRYDLLPTAPAGTYRITFTNPGSYLPGVSQIIPPTTGAFNGTGLPDPQSIGAGSTAPTGSAPTVYYLEFIIDPMDPTYPNIINNHIPIDPILDGAIRITKSTPLTNVSKGELVPYTIVAANTLAANISNIDITDAMPPGFSYVPNSATIDGAVITPVQNGRNINFTNLTFNNGQSRTIKILLRVGLGVTEGQYTNSAFALNNVVGAQVSNTGRATVRVVPDAIFDCPEIIGKVFDDINMNGYYDKGEPGLANVQVATSRGWLINTDKNGRYHIACPAIPNEDIGSNFVLKVNNRSLPTGYRLTTHNPKLTRLTRGKTTKVNFGASIDHVIHLEVLGDLNSKELNLISEEIGERRATLRTSFIGMKKNRNLKNNFEKMFSNNKNLNFEYEWINKSQNIKVNSEQRSQYEVYEDPDARLVEKDVTKVYRQTLKIEPDLKVKVSHDDVADKISNLDEVLSEIKLEMKSRDIKRIHIVSKTDLRSEVIANEIMAQNLNVQVTMDKSSQEASYINLYFKKYKKRKKAQTLIVKGLKKAEKSEMSLDKILGEKNKEEILSEEISLTPDNVIVINFATLSSKNLNIEKIIDQIIKINKGKGIQRIHVVGHTDSSPIRGRSLLKYANNVELSKSRAFAVAGKLLEANLGIQLSFDGKGFKQPVASNDTAAGKAKNRRTEVKLYYKKGENKGLIAEFKCSVDENKNGNVARDGDVKLERQDQQRCMDVQLERVALQVKHNPLSKLKRLDVGQVNSNTFEFYSNYYEYIDKAELVLRNKSAYSQKERVLKIDNLKSMMSVKLPDDLSDTMTYQLRVFSGSGHYDETQEKALIQNSNFDYKRIWGESTLLTSGISVNPGAISVNGEGIPTTHKVFVMGEEIPVGVNGRFVVEQRFKENKEYGIEILVVDKDGKGIEYRRDIYIPRQDWFAVGLIDITAGQNSASANARLVRQDDHHFDEKLYVDGRISAYVKGKTNSGVNVTASVDTRESEIDQLFSNFLAKDPISIFRRIDPQEYYPVYGDDSTFEEDAPTQGKVYVKVEKNNNYFTWGNFRTKLTATEFSQYDRAFYGAKVHLESKKQVGEDKATELDIFAAAPETQTQRDEFRGTGSSFYSLRRRDIVRGSDRVRVEIRDINSQIVIGSRTLVAETDYSINYINGQILLSSPLESFSTQSTLVRNGSTSGNTVFLVVNYEYIPGFEDLDALAIGGKFSQWLGKKLKVGINGVEQEQRGQEFKQYGADLTYKIGESGHIKLEWAQTDGLGNQEVRSLDGGFGFTDQRVTQARKANAYYAELATDLYTTKAGLGKLSAYFRKRDEGFAATGQQTDIETDQYGVEVTLPIGSRLKVLAKYDFSDRKNFVEVNTIDTRADLQITDKLSLAVGYKKEERDLANNTFAAGFGVLAQAIGAREDVTAQISHRINSDLSWYVFGQKTLDTTQTRIENDRYGLGVDARFKGKYTLGFEVSDGDGGIGSQVRTGYKIDEQTETYLSYLLENNNNDTLITPLAGSRGSLVSGVKRRYDETNSIYYENKYEHGRSQPVGLTHNIGVELTPFTKWTVALNLETGRLRDQNQTTEIERRSGSIGIARSDEKTKFALNVEYREDEQANNDRETLLVKARYDRVLNESWKLLVRGNHSDSQSSQGDFFDGDYTEGALAFAYRPVLNDKLNMLFRYSFTEILPSIGQLSNDGSIPDFRQRTQQLSVDTVYDLGKYLSVGAKYGFALRQLQNSRVGGQWFRSNAHIGVLRFDVHINNSWDMMLEGRRLWFEGDEQERIGAVIGIFKYLDKQNRVRFGGGYSFADFSDDLTQLDYDYDGWFVNLTGAF